MIHHTADDCNIEAINRSHYNRTHWMNTSSFGSDISYHYIVFTDWGIQQTRKETEIGLATRVNNDWTVHVALCGNFINKRPSIAQYQAIEHISNTLADRYGRTLPLTTHKWADWEHTSCPWWVDVGVLSKIWAKVGEFKLTNYYSPNPNQTKFAYSTTLGRRRNWAEEATMQCWRWAITDPSWCLRPAYWPEYNDALAGKVMACDRERDNQTLYIEWYWFVQCRDRWGSIVGKRLDIRAGIGERALERIESWEMWVPPRADVYLVRP